MADESLFTGFHGTSTPSLRLEDLDPRHAVESEGTVFFTSNEDMAHSFTLPREYGETVWERPTGEFGESGEELYADIEPGPVLRASLRIRNPFRLRGEEAQQAIDDTTYQGEILRRARSGGFDGVVFEDVTEFADPGVRGDVYAVFNKLRSSGSDEPRPPEQSNLPAVLEAASAASQLLGPRDEPRPKGKLQGGIGALRKAPWFALARMAWNELSPEQRGAAEDYAKQAYGSLEAGIDAAQEWTGRQNFPEGFVGGLEWAKDALGFGDQEPSGIMSLPDLQKYRSLFHGGPYQWAPEPGYPEGRARLDKQGTGEGAAAYGWGAYLAEAPGVATDYKVRLVDRTGNQTLEDNTKIPSWVANKVNAGQADEVRQDFLSRIAEADRKVAAKEGQYWLEEQKIEGLREVVSAIDKMVGGQTASSGALYQLDIPEADTDRLLDYDAPLSEQPKILNKIFSITGKTADELKALDVNFEALSERLLEHRYGTKQRQALQAEWDAAFSDPQRKIGSVLARMDRPIGTFGYDAASQQTGGALISALGKTQETSEFLRKADIPGLKYFDQMSRGGKEGTRNYVVWDQDLLDRLKTVRKEARGGFIDKPLYDQPRMLG
jgi:hypothetical protein